jgi:hypothetical protein
MLIWSAVLDASGVAFCPGVGQAFGLMQEQSEILSTERQRKLVFVEKRTDDCQTHLTLNFLDIDRIWLVIVPSVRLYDSHPASGPKATMTIVHIVLFKISSSLDESEVAKVGTADMIVVLVCERQTDIWGENATDLNEDLRGHAKFEGKMYTSSNSEAIYCNIKWRNRQQS